MDLGIILLVFGVIFIAELPDKSLFASLVLSTKYHGFTVWVGAATAFLVHVVIAVTAGKLLTLLPHTILEIIIAGLFFLGALLLLLGRHGIEGEHHGHKASDTHSFLKVFMTSFSVVFIGEWGDITQITIANYTAKYHNALSVGVGATIGLWAVTGLAIFAGTKVLSLIKPEVLQKLTASILLFFAILSLFSAFK